MINNTLILVVLHLYYLLSDLSNMLLSVNLGMKSNHTKMFAQVAKVQLSVTFSPLTVTEHDASKLYILWQPCEHLSNATGVFKTDRHGIKILSYFL